jgi:toxin-antitoxin system PIN domain toxin
MSFTIDTNVLVYASNTDAPEYPRASELIGRVLRGPELTTVFWPVLTAYLRIVTHPAILPVPLSAAQAESNVSALESAPGVRVVGAGRQFWPCYRTLGGARGNDVPDAVIVALMLERGVGTMASRDRDFRRYGEITVRDPLAD